MTCTGDGDGRAPAGGGAAGRRRADRHRWFPPVRPSPRRPARGPGRGRSCAQARTFALHQLARTDRRLRRRPVPDRRGARPALAHQRHRRLAGRVLAGPALAGLPGRRPAGRGPAGPRRGRRRSPYGRTTPPPTTSASCCRPASGAAPLLAGRSQDAAVVRRAAAALATRYVPVGRRDPLLGRPGRPGHGQRRQPDEPRAAVPGGATSGDRPEWRDLAVQHALTSARWQLRPDGSTFHVVRLDEQTGHAGLARHGAGRLRRLDLGPRAGLGGARLHHGVPRVGRRAAARRGPPDRRLRGGARARGTACRGGTTTRRAPAGTPRRRRSSRPACSSWPGSTPTPDLRAQLAGRRACAPCGRWSGRATWLAAPARGRCCCRDATTRRTTTAA